MPYMGSIQYQQAIAGCLLQYRQYAVAWQTTAGFERVQLEALFEAQLIKGKLKHRFSFRQVMLTIYAVLAARTIQIGLRVSLFPAPRNYAMTAIGNLAVGASADTDIVGETPVIQVVAATPSGLCEGGHFILSIAMRGEL